MSLPKILIMVDWFYPGFKGGGPIQSCRNFISAMHPEFDIYILCSDRDLGDSVPYKNIQTGKWTNYQDQAQVFYSPLAEVDVEFLEKMIRELNPDYIYLNSMFSYRFTILPLWLRYRNRLHAKLVLAPRGMLQAGAMQFKSFKKKLFISAINLSGLPKWVQFHATDDQEQKDILQHFPGTGEPIVATNFPKVEIPDFVPVEKEPGILRLAFISRLVPKKNLHFLLELLGKLPSTIQCHLTIRGAFEDDTYKNLCEGLIKNLPGNISVQSDGAIQNEMIPALIQQHHVFVLPTMGENFGHVIFEALAAGRPVLISDRTPWKDLEQSNAGWSLSLDNPAMFLQVLQDLGQMDQAALNQWCVGARQSAINFLAQSDIKEQYKKLFH